MAASDFVTPLKCIAVDDEPFALKLLADDLGRLPGIDLVQTCSNPQEAASALKKFPVDLMFLDIQMPGLTGMQLLRSLEHPPLVVVTTAYENYAVEGFELDVVDYLVKPIPADRLVRAVDKVRERVKARRTSGELSSEAFFFVKSEYKEIKIYFDSIRYVEGLKDYVKIFLENQPHPVLTRMNLKAMEARLPADRFSRVHNSYIVPLKKITSFQRSHVFIGDHPIPVGDKFYNDFVKQYRGQA